MKNMNVIMLVVVLLYAISPVDLAVGPLDDIIVLILGYIMRKKIGSGDGN